MASSNLRLLHRLRSYLTVEAACNVYSMMILPLITYSTTTEYRTNIYNTINLNCCLDVRLRSSNVMIICYQLMA